MSSSIGRVDASRLRVSGHEERLSCGHSHEQTEECQPRQQTASRSRRRTYRLSLISPSPRRPLVSKRGSSLSDNTHDLPASTQLAPHQQQQQQRRRRRWSQTRERARSDKDNRRRTLPSLLVDTPPHDNPACLLAAHVRWRGWMALLERGASLRSTTLPWLSVPDR